MQNEPKASTSKAGDECLLADCDDHLFLQTNMESDECFKPWLLEQNNLRKRKVDQIKSSPSKSSQSKTTTTPKKRKIETPQKNTLLNYFASPTKSPSKSSVAKKLLDDDGTSPSKSETVVKKLPDDDNDIEIVPFTKKVVEVDLTVSPRASNSTTTSESKISIVKSEPKSRTENDEDFDSDSTYVSESEIRSTKDKDGVEKELNDVYDLLETGMSWDWDGDDEVFSDLEKLPPEILENIFCQLPLHELCLNLCLVNKRWNRIIFEPRFLQWKKTYHKLKSKLQSTKESVALVCKTNEMDLGFPNFLRFVRTFKTLKPNEMENMLLCLQWHSKYRLAEDVLKERLPDCFNDAKRPNPWCVIVILCILSRSVHEVSRIIHCLTHSRSSCVLLNVIEFFYCMATFFLHFKECFILSPGYHYRVFYALSLFENTGMVCARDLTSLQSITKGQQSVRKYVDGDSKLRLTHEQKRILNHQLKDGDVVKIVAFAGTGKTTTLVELTRLWPSKRFLSVVYNKSICDYVQKLYPGNVKCQTAHSVAYQTVGKWYRSKLTFQLKAWAFRSHFSSGNVMLRSSMALKTINKFVSSSDELITIAHVPNTRTDSRGTVLTLGDDEKLQFCDDAIHIWKMMRDVKNRDVKISHDVYLKIYQLEKLAIEGYDCILLDEAQDYSQAMLSIFLNQTCPKIIVGDPNQQMYGFRGAINSMDSIDATHVYYLTQSFRFGPEIAYVASCALEMMNQTKKTIVGTDRPCSYSGKSEGQVAVIARTNYELFSEAVSLFCLGKENVSGAFLGGIRSFDFAQLMDIFYLMLPQYSEDFECWEIKNKFIKNFNSFNELKNYALTTEDTELLGKIKIVEHYNTRLPGYIRTIKERCNHDVASADVVFTTAHKAKGHEFDTVRLAKDFLVDCFASDCHMQLYCENKEDEMNIVYVAITRAKRCLVLSPPVVVMLLVAGERFEYPVAARCFEKELWFDEGSFECVECEESRPFRREQAVVLKRDCVQLIEGQSIKGGLLCDDCAASPYELQRFASPVGLLPALIDNFTALLFLVDQKNGTKNV